jgi:trk system potassium uptake protein TrkH
MISFKSVSNVIGFQLIVIGIMMFFPMVIAYIWHDGEGNTFAYSALITIFTGLALNQFRLKSLDNARVRKREGYLIVGLGWIAMSVFCALPYVFGGIFDHFTQALFESVSGLTTTGASTIADIEIIPHSILFWRSLTQWLGGMGIIVLAVAIFPLLGIGGVELFVAEAPGPTSDKIHPRIKEVAKRIWLIYVGLTALLCLLLSLNGMTFFDAINHSLTTLSTGGFSTKNASVAYYNIPAIHYIIALFMFIGGTNYTIIYFGLSGQFKKVLKSQEFKLYVSVVLGFTMIVAFYLYNLNNYQNFEIGFRQSLFQVISVITTTGFVTADYTSWSPFITLLFFGLLFLGACAGSTAGGIKLIRHLVFIKNSILEFKRLLHPRALIRIKIDGNIVAARILTHILVFLLLYLIIFIVSTVVMGWFLRDFPQPLLTAAGSTATCLGNVGPAIGQVGPLNNFVLIPESAKLFLCFVMLLGRLELFTILILFMPYFWRSN